MIIERGEGGGGRWGRERKGGRGGRERGGERGGGRNKIIIIMVLDIWVLQCDHVQIQFCISLDVCIPFLLTLFPVSRSVV